MLLRKKVIVGLTLLTLTSPVSVFCGDDFIEQKKADIDTMEMRLSELRGRRGDLKVEVSRLAELITGLKSKDEIGVRERRKLDGYLKRSQELVSEFDVLSAQIAEQEDARRAAMEDLLEVYQKEIDEIVAHMKAVDRTPKREEAVSLLSMLVTLRDEKWRLREKLGLRVLQIDDIFDVKIDSLEGPKEISEKADLVTDMADKLRLKIALCDGRIDELMNEKNIRERVGQFLEETMLFDEADEQMSHVLARLSDETERSNAPPDFEWQGAGWEGVGVDDGSIRKGDIVLNFDDTEFWQQIQLYSSEDIDLLVKALRSERARLAAQVKVLDEKAAAFYKRADHLQNTIEK